jgi:hypothetical protein
MFRFIGLCLGTLVRLLRARRSLLLENLALRQQLAVLKRRPWRDLLVSLLLGVAERPTLREIAGRARHAAAAFLQLHPPSNDGPA